MKYNIVSPTYAKYLNNKYATGGKILLEYATVNGVKYSRPKGSRKLWVDSDGNIVDFSKKDKLGRVIKNTVFDNSSFLGKMWNTALLYTPRFLKIGGNRLAEALLTFNTPNTKPTTKSIFAKNGEGDEIPKIYTVKNGDSLSKISRNTGINMQDLVSYNNITNPNLILPGLLLKLSDNSSNNSKWKNLKLFDNEKNFNDTLAI